ncbi:amino acid adenylation domain-containing protein [Pseudoalteromonas sp. SMS1]|uniref:amino acid adenylation domain-containing protein n=1 Tax=Pseudoalteromonas sp. SMS1 TaxID=2908894 RepID=UPI001F31FE55|nr:amino acid adenylation domain-containing protein [Pseudoalteromonas sp. SMS1]MCF2859882.1 amino acid adenylation domain-containing protein [Pseudoalteromonas sp. SMS1]
MQKANGNATGNVLGVQCDTVYALIKQHAQLTPEKIAIIDGEIEVTYEQLMSAAWAITSEIKKQQIPSGSLIAVCMVRKWNLIATMIGIHKAGCAYIPIDPNYPKSRVEYMLSHSKVHAAIIDSHEASDLCANVSHCINIQSLNMEAQNTEPAGSPVSSDLAYVIYTSGSTGNPKGVAIAHHNLMAMSRALRQLFGQRELQGVLAAASVCFDTSVMETLGTLSLGGTLILAKNALALPTLPHADKVKACVMVPSSMQALLNTGPLPKHIECVVFGGEALKSALVDKIHGVNPRVRVVNAYGPTEDTVFSTLCEIEVGAKNIPIGRPVEGTYAYILDEGLHPVEKGIAGELYLGGDKLASGYLHDHSQTRHRFIELQINQHAPKQRMYRTGDLCRWNTKGEIEFVGRIDQQVKIRGFRIELGEIESVLESLPFIDAAAVNAVESENGQKSLVAYVVEKPNAPSHDTLRALLLEQLPNYMVPHLFMSLDALPLLPNEKLDRSKLPSLTEVRLANQASPEWINEVESKDKLTNTISVIRQALATLLGISEPARINPNTSFDSLGIDSLNLLELSSRISRTLNVAISPTHIAAYPTPALLGTHIIDGQSQQHTEPSEGNHQRDTLHQFQTLLQSSHPTFGSASVQAWDINDKSLLVEAILNMVNRLQRNPYGKVLKTGSSARGLIGDSYHDEQRQSIIWSTNLYFGFNRDPEVIAHATDALQNYGTGMGISAAATGMTDQHVAFEKEFAELVGKSSACLFPTGYTANLGAISGILGPNDIVVIDQLCHASIVDGARLSGATVRTFKHNDKSDLATILAAEQSPYRTTLVVLESVYSMGEGTAPVADIVNTAKQYGALVLVDEAHSFGFYGKRGAGVCVEQGVSDQVDFIMTTLSKALGSIGGVIAASEKHINLLKSASRAYIFQASISPADIAAALASLRILQNDDAMRAQLWDRTRYMRTLFQEAGFDLGTGDGPIVTPHFGDKDKLYAIVQSLYQRGVQTLAVTYPIVEKGRGRLRFICSAAHTYADIDHTVNALIEAEKEVNAYFEQQQVNISNANPVHLATSLYALTSWRDTFAGYIKMYLQNTVTPQPELAISIKLQASEPPLTLTIEKGQLCVSQDAVGDLPYCELTLVSQKALEALKQHNVQSLLETVCQSGCILNGQSEVFVWFIARLIEYGHRDLQTSITNKAVTMV